MSKNIQNSSRIQEIKEYLLNIWANDKPLAKTIKTDSAGYIYDPGTNKILLCNQEEFLFLFRVLNMPLEQAIALSLSDFGQELFIKTIDCIQTAIDNEQVLKTRKNAKFGLSGHYHDYENIIQDLLSMIILEVTDKCNLRCGYCIYNPRIQDKRNHGNRDMELSTAKAAIDYLKSHSSKLKEIGITFYGGEPLLNFDIIKKSVCYASQIIRDKKVRFSLTTNGVLLNRSMTEFFFKNNFSLVFSIDGPRDIHDSYRKDIKGNGSYKQATEGLRTALDIFGEHARNRIGLSMVYTPPFSVDRIKKILTLWDEFPQLPTKLNLNITYPESQSLPMDGLCPEDLIEDKNLLQWAFEEFIKYYNDNKIAAPIFNSIVEKNLARLMQRPIYDVSFDMYHLNGCCIPAVRKLYISVDGTLRLCERMADNAPTIGNIHTGLDVEIIKKYYIDEYGQKSLPTCSSCWAIRLCPICYTSAYRAGRFDIANKNKTCSAIRRSQEAYLKLLCYLLEKNPNGLDYLYQWEIK